MFILQKKMGIIGFEPSPLLLAMLSRFRLLLVVIIKIPRFLMKSGFQSFNFHFSWVQSPCFAMQNLSKARPQHLQPPCVGVGFGFEFNSNLMGLYGI